MSQRTDKVNNYLNTFKGKVIGAIMASILMILIGWKDDIVAQFNEGQALLEQKEYDEKLDTALTKRFNDPVWMGKMMNSKYMREWRANERHKLTEEIKHEDATKLKMSAYLSDETGMSKQAMMNTLVVIVNERKHGKKYVTNKQCIRNVKEYCKGRGSHTMMRN